YGLGKVFNGQPLDSHRVVSDDNSGERPVIEVEAEGLERVRLRRRQIGVLTPAKSLNQFRSPVNRCCRRGVHMELFGDRSNVRSEFETTILEKILSGAVGSKEREK